MTVATPQAGGFSFDLLGPFLARWGDDIVRIGSTKQRSVLVQLLLGANRVIPAETLIDGLWGESPPTHARATLQVHVAALRRALSRPSAPDLILTEPPGYMVSLANGSLDAQRFRDLHDQARAASRTGNASLAAALLRQALAQWRGPAIADLLNEPFAPPIAARLEEERLDALDARIDADLALGMGAEIIGELQELTAHHPLRERSRAQLVVALYRCGRQADALATIADARTVLRDELGLDPGPELQRLEKDVLAQSDALLWKPKTRRAATTSRISGLQGRLELIVDESRNVIVTTSCTIGRDDDNDVVIDDASVSRRHARVRPTLAGYLIVDDHSTNGTIVNGNATDQAILQVGDIITIGRCSLRVRTIQEPDPRIMTNVLSQYVPESVARRLVGRGLDTGLPDPGGSVTFLFTDVVGSTRAWDAWPDRMSQAMRQHDSLIEEVIERNGGALVRPRGEGDSRFGVFVRPDDGAKAAIEVQRRCDDEDWPTPEPIRVRMALHVGEAELREGDYYGSPVNRCARIRSLAAAGQVLLSAAMAESVRDNLPEGAELRDQGLRQLKDLTEPERIFELSDLTRRK